MVCQQAIVRVALRGCGVSSGLWGKRAVLEISWGEAEAAALLSSDCHWRYRCHNALPENPAHVSTGLPTVQNHTMTMATPAGNEMKTGTLNRASGRYPTKRASTAPSTAYGSWVLT